MGDERAPAHWVRVQTLADVAGWLAVLAMAGTLTTAEQAAEDEAAMLRKAGARVLRDTGGRPCVHEADPVVITWRAALDGRVTDAAAALEAAMEAGRHG